MPNAHCQSCMNVCVSKCHVRQAADGEAGQPCKFDYEPKLIFPRQLKAWGSAIRKIFGQAWVAFRWIPRSQPGAQRGSHKTPGLTLRRSSLQVPTDMSNSDRVPSTRFTEKMRLPNKSPTIEHNTISAKVHDRVPGCEVRSNNVSWKFRPLKHPCCWGYSLGLFACGVKIEIHVVQIGYSFQEKCIWTVFDGFTDRGALIENNEAWGHVHCQCKVFGSSFRPLGARCTIFETTLLTQARVMLTFHKN